MTPEPSQRVGDPLVAFGSLGIQHLWFIWPSLLGWRPSLLGLEVLLYPSAGDPLTGHLMRTAWCFLVRRSPVGGWTAVDDETIQYLPQRSRFKGFQVACTVDVLICFEVLHPWLINIVPLFLYMFLSDLHGHSIIPSTRFNFTRK